MNKFSGSGPSNENEPAPPERRADTAGTPGASEDTRALYEALAAGKKARAAAIAASGEHKPAPPELAPNPAIALEFLKTLRPHGPYVLTSIVPDGATTTKSFEAGDSAGAMAFIEERNRAGENIYHTLNSCGRPTRKPGKADMTGAIALHVDSDPSKGESIEDAKPRIMAAYETHRPPPSIIVDSGNGLQGIWLLDREFPFPPPPPGPKSKMRDAAIQANVAPIEDRNRALAIRVGAPAGTHNADRLLRLPGTVNFPNAAKRAQRRVPCLSGAVKLTNASYSPEMFPTAPGTGARPKSGPGPGAGPKSGPGPGPGPERGKDNSRSAKAFHAGATVKGFGASYEEMRELLLGHKDPEIAEWARTKGMANGERELRRIYDRVEVDGPDTPGDDPDTPETDKEADEMDAAILALKMPAIDPKAFYGPLKEIVEAATKHSEATKIGVALQVIVHVSLCLRPFCIKVGDPEICLNLFVLFIGLSSLARKGTSSFFANKFVILAIQTLARELRQSFNYDCADRENARRAVNEAQRNAERARDITDANAAEITARIKALKNEKIEIEKIVADWKKPPKHPRSPRTQKNYEMGVQEKEARIAELETLILDAEGEYALIAAVLADPAGAIAAADAALTQAQADETALPAPRTPKRWEELFMELENPPVPMPGLTSGEGIIEKIRDPRPRTSARDDKGDEGVKEKRGFADLSEFGSVLLVIQRSGSTLSTTLRIIHDCEPITTGGRTNPAAVKEPYVCVSAAITPAEFRQLTFEDRKSTSADNGLVNRFLTAYVAREKLVPRPLPTEGRDELTRKLAENILKVYRDLEPAEPFRHTVIDFTPEAWAIYGDEDNGVYQSLARLSGASSKADKMLVRTAINLRKLAAILAVLNGESVISAGALEAAVAWIEYSVTTADAVAATATDRLARAELKKDAKKILTELKALGGDAGFVPARDVYRNARLKKTPFEAALKFLTNRPPSPIEITEENKAIGNGAFRKQVVLRLTQTKRDTKVEPEGPSFSDDEPV